MGKIVRCLGNQELVPDASLQILQSEKVILPAGFAGRRSAAAQAHTAARGLEVSGPVFVSQVS
jgi:hypothetical protein